MQLTVCTKYVILLQAHISRVTIPLSNCMPLILNNQDLIRHTLLPSAEAKDVATTYDCNYIETSAALNHKVDELVAGTLTQIRRQLLPPTPTLLPVPTTKSRSRTPSPVSFFNKLFKKPIKGSASCEGIFMK